MIVGLAFHSHMSRDRFRSNGHGWIHRQVTLAAFPLTIAAAAAAALIFVIVIVVIVFPHFETMQRGVHLRQRSRHFFDR